MENTQPVDQAPAQSMDDKIAAMFGYADEEQPETRHDGRPYEASEETPEEPQEGEAEATPVETEVEVDLDGKKFRVPKDLEPAIMRHADYTRKTQELAEQRRLQEQTQAQLNLAAMEREFSQSVATETQQVAQLESYLRSLKAQDFNEMPVEEGFRQWMLIQQANEQRELLTKAIESKRSEFKREFDAALAARKAETRELLAKRYPDFNDAAITALRDYAKTQGFTEAAFDNIALDAKSMAVIYKAAQYDKLQADKVAAVQKASPVVKPGSSNPMPQQVKDKLAFQKAMKSAKTSQDKARLIERKLAGEFR